MNEFRVGGFQILPPVIKNLLIINALFFLATVVFKKAGWIDLDYYLALFHWSSPLFKPWQIITHLFMHGSFMHLFFNMFALWMFGNVIENQLGAKKFLLFYFICGIGAAACHMLVFTWENYEAIKWASSIPKDVLYNMTNTTFAQKYGSAGVIPLATPVVGASGAVFGVLFAFGYLYPNMIIYFNFLFPIKAKYFVAIYAALELFAGFRNSPADNVAHFAHLGGMLFAWLFLRFYYKQNRFRRYY